MVIIRVLKGIQHHFPTRIAEWFLAVALLNWGLILLGYPTVFTTFPSYAGLAFFANEYVWGIAAFIVGIGRLFALAINGTFSGTLYSNYSPHIRGFIAFLSCFFWSQIVMSYLLIFPLNPAIAIYSTLLMMDLWSMAASWSDAGKSDKEKLINKTDDVSEPLNN